MNSRSLSALPVGPPLEPSDFGIDRGKLPSQSCHDALGLPAAVRDHTDVRSAEAHLAGEATQHVARELGSVEGGIHIVCEGNAVPVPPTDYLPIGFFVNKKMRSQDSAPVRSDLGEKIRELRKGRGLNQPEFAKLLKVPHQSAISRWEKGESTVPSRVLLGISELAPAEERQWWRDQAAIAAGLSTESSGNRGGGTSGLLPLEESNPTIRYIAAKKSGGQFVVIDCVEGLSLPRQWFASGGAFRALKVQDPIASVMAGECTALIDISHRDAKSLIDCVVAARTVDGIRPRWLRGDGERFFLQPLGGGPVRPLQFGDGEDSIVGRVAKWIGDAPAPRLPSNAQVARKLKKKAGTG